MPDTDPSTLIEQIAALVKRAPKPTNDDEEEDMGGGGRAQERIRRLVAERNEAREQLAQVNDLAGQLKGTYEAQIAQLKEETARQVGTLQQRHVEDIALRDLNVEDPHGRGALRDYWSGLPEESRGKSAVEWWSGVVEAHKAHAADPKTAQAPDVPRTLAGYLPPLGDTATKPAQVQSGLRSSAYATPDRGARSAPPADAAARFAGAKSVADIFAIAGEIDRS